MHVLKITGNNFMRLKAVDVELEDGVVKITGKNRQGKSTLLKMIESLGGKKAMPEMPLTDGAKKGEFTITLGDDEPELVAKWSFNDKNNPPRLSLESSKEGKYSNPAEVLHGLISAMIDPWTFYNQALGSASEVKKAVKLIKELFVCEFDCEALVVEMGYDEIPIIRTMLTEHKDNPLDFLKAFEGEVFAERAKRNKTVKELEGAIDVLCKEVPLGDRELEVKSVNSLIEERDVINQVKAQHDKFSMGCEGMENEVTAAKARYEQLQANLDAKRAEANDLPVVDIARLEEISTDIEQLEERNDRARKAGEIKAKEETLEKKRSSAQDYDDDHKKIVEKSLVVMSEAQMPVDNMTLEDGKIMLNGIPFSQASSAEALAASIDVAVAKNPKVRTLVCHNASLLDADSMMIIEEKSKEHDFQMLMEVVADEAQPGLIFVDDGVAVNTKEEE